MRILLVNDEAEYLEDFLTEIEKQYVVDVAYNGTDGAYLSEVNDYDLIVIDSSLPDMTCSDLCKNTRQAKVQCPILLLGDKNNSSYGVASLEAGADALLQKPLDIKTFTAQAAALIRRSNNIPSSVISIKDIDVDLNYKNVFYKGKRINLRRKEYDILEYLVLNRGNVVAKEKLLEHAWGEGIYVQSNTLEVHVGNLRRVLRVSTGKELIKTMRGFGYKIE